MASKASSRRQPIKAIKGLAKGPMGLARFQKGEMRECTGRATQARLNFSGRSV
jgi:hypothetical protein